MQVEKFGQLQFIHRDKEWFGLMDNIHPDRKVELSLSVDSEQEDICDKVELVRQVACDYESIVSVLYQLVFQKYKGTEFEKTLSEVKKMYSLSAISLKCDNRTWWLTLEPEFSVTSIYNHFLRFTMVDRDII